MSKSDLAKQRNQLAEQEARIRSAVAEAFVTAGNALAVIRGGKLYKIGGFETFEEYCRVTWQMERAHAYRLIAASEVQDILSPMGDITPPGNERIARELTPLLPAPETMAEAWTEAVKTAPVEHEQPSITAKHVKAVVRTYLHGGEPPPPLTDGKEAHIILCDPPWQYAFSKSPTRDIENQYPTMSTEKIGEMAEDVQARAADDCVLFLWATSPKLLEAFDVLKAWEFIYKTCAVWDKEKIGMGYYFRQQHELLLVATRGAPHPPPPEARKSSVIRAPRGKHSEKPVEVYELIEEAYPDKTHNKLEMFLRGKPRKGWLGWGNECDETKA